MQSEVFFVENDIHRRDKTNYYLDLAEAVSQRCTCLRRHYGAVIVKNVPAGETVVGNPARPLKKKEG